MDYNHELMDPIEPYSRTVLTVLTLLGGVMDLFSIKWTCIANYFLYHECLVRMAAIMIPHNYGSHLDIYTVTVRFAVNYSALYCDTNFSLPIFANTLASVFDIYFARSAYNSEITVLESLRDICLILLMFVA